MGLAVTLAPVVALKPLAGDHVYELALEAERLVLPPLQMVTPGEIPKIGLAFTVTITVVVFWQPAEVPVMV